MTKTWDISAVWFPRHSQVEAGLFKFFREDPINPKSMYKKCNILMAKYSINAPWFQIYLN